MGLRISDDEIEAVINSQPEAIEIVLIKIKDCLFAIKAGQKQIVNKLNRPRGPQGIRDYQNEEDDLDNFG